MANIDNTLARIFSNRPKSKESKYEGLNLPEAERQSIKLIKIVEIEPNPVVDLVLHVEQVRPETDEPKRFTVLAPLSLKRSLLKLFQEYEVEDEQDFVGLEVASVKNLYLPNSPIKMWEVQLSDEWLAKHPKRKLER